MILSITITIFINKSGSAYFKGIGGFKGAGAGAGGKAGFIFKLDKAEGKA